MIYSFDTNIAKLYGVDEAIFVHNIFYWVLHNEANGTNIKEYEGKLLAWTHNSLKAFSIIFPFWTSRQMERIVKSCIEKKLVIAVNHNDDKTDRTLWYTVTDAVVSIYANGEMDFTKRGEPFHRTVKCIDIYNNIDISTNSKPYSKQEDASHPSDRVKPTVARTCYGEYKWVKLTDAELEKLIEKYGAEMTAKAIEFVDMQAEKTKNRNGWKSWSAVIHNAIRNNWGGIKDA